MVFSPLRALSILVASAALAALPAQAAITFTPGHYYTSNYFSTLITQYNGSGVAVGTLAVPTATDLRGLAFGPDSLLYATSIGSNGFSVLAMNASGSIARTYAMQNAFLSGNISYGKLAVDAQNIFVAGGNSLYRFDTANPNSGASIFTTNQVYDVEMLPNGNLLVASAYEINEITRAGTLVRKVVPNPAALLTDARGVEFNPATNDIFATHLGNSNGFFQTMRFDGTSGALERSTTFSYGDDLFLTGAGNLLVGSRTDAPRIFTQDLNEVLRFQGGSQMFVTQFLPIPEPGTAVFGLAVLAFCGTARRRGRPGAATRG